MKYLAASSLALALLLSSSPATSRDDRLRFPLKIALARPGAIQKLDKGVQLFFGKTKHPRADITFGEFKTNKKTNAFNKSDQEACDWAFLSAILQLQQRARKEGGNAVVEIESNYKDIPFSSETEYECGAGKMMAGVAFKGKVVKL